MRYLQPPMSWYEPDDESEDYDEDAEQCKYEEYLEDEQDYLNDQMRC